MATEFRANSAPAPLVALCGWLVPGAGYLLIGEIGRSVTIGCTIIALFVAGLLLGGVRVIEVPGFNVETGEKQMVQPSVTVKDAVGREAVVPAQEPMLDPTTHRPMLTANGQQRMMNVPKKWVMDMSITSEIREKPWSVPQVLAGPIAIAGGWASIKAAEIDPKTSKIDPVTGMPDPKTGSQYGATAHARINEIPSLYLSVAGLLNLMAIIDCTWRASQITRSGRKCCYDPAAGLPSVSRSDAGLELLVPC